MNQSVIRTMTDRTMAPQIKICSAIATLPPFAQAPQIKIRSAIAWVYLRSLSEAAAVGDSVAMAERISICGA